MVVRTTFCHRSLCERQPGMPPCLRRPWVGAPQEGLLVESGPEGITLAGFLARWAALTVRQPRR